MLLSEEDQGQLALLNAPLQTDEVGGEAASSRVVLPQTGQLTNTMAGIYALWKFMVYTNSEAEFDVAWQRLQTQFPDQVDIIGYLREHYLPWKKQWAGPWVSRYQNFGQRTTSPTESAHRELKGYLTNGLSSLHKMHEAIHEMLLNKETAFNERIAEQKRRLRNQFNGGGFGWLGTTNREVSYKAVDKLNTQKMLVIASETGLQGPRPLPPCTGAFTIQWGIPCAHELASRLADGKVLTRADFHRFWWLDRSLDEEFPLLKLKEPDIITALKGRPRDSGPICPTASLVCASNADGVCDTNNCESETHETVPEPKSFLLGGGRYHGSGGHCEGV